MPQENSSRSENKMDGRFGQWLRNSIPEMTEDRVRSEVQLAVLKERLRSRKAQRRKRVARFGMVALPVVLVAAISVSFVDLGGDGFELEGNGSFGDFGDLYEYAFRGGGFSVQDLSSEEEIQEFNHQLAAGEGVDIGLEGWLIHGITKWTIFKEYNVMGKLVETGSFPEDTASDYPPDFLNFLENYWNKYKRQQISGENQPDGNMTQEFDGTKFNINYWTISTKQFGPVTYYRGIPIH